MRWRFGRFQVHGQCEELLLPYLSEAGITTYLVQRFGEAVFSPALVRALHQRTNGNPLFLVTVVEEMVRQGRLRGPATGEERPVHHATAVMVDIPESLRHVIDQQLEQLHPEERFCLEVASVAGRAFSAAAVAAGTDDQVEEMETRYAALARRGYGGAAVGRGICGPGDYARGAILGRTQHVHARLSAHRHGCAVEGLEQMQAGWAAIQTTGVQLNRVSFLARLAEALLHAGQPDTGLAVLAEALAFIHTSGERWWEAECHRLWGECLLAQQKSKHEAREVAARFQHALDIARHQHARSLELCAAMSLSRLWQQQGKREEAMRDSSSAVI